MRNAKKLKGERIHIKGLEEKIENLNRKVERIEKYLKEILNHLKPEDKRIIYLEKILKHPKEYGFQFMEGMSIGELLKKREVDRLTLSDKLGIPFKDALFLQCDKILPDENVSKKLINLLKVSPSDFSVCKAKTYKKIKSSPPLPSLPPPAEEYVRPYIYLDTLELINQTIQKEARYEIIGFFTNLFIRNISGNLYSTEASHYKKKSDEEIRKIMNLRDSEKAIIIEYPSEVEYSSKKFKFLMSEPIGVLQLVQYYSNSIFVRVKLEKKPKFYRLVPGPGYVDTENVTIEDLTKGKITKFSTEEFVKIWERTEFEFIVFCENSHRALDTIHDYISEMVVTEEFAYLNEQIDKGTSEHSIIYSAFKSKWIRRLTGFPRYIEYVIEPDFY